MYIDIDKHFRVNLMDMEGDEILALISMIRGAGLEERRVFNRVFRQLTEVPADKLMKP